MLKYCAKIKIAAGILCLAILLGATPFVMADTFGNNETDNASTPISSAIENNTAGIQAISYTVTASVLNVRSGPGTTYPIVGQVYKGDIVWYNPELPSGYSSWTPIYKGQLEGYVASQYLQEN